MKLRYQILDENRIQPFIGDLRDIEKNIEYPLDDGTEGFYIDHGEKYTPFFTQQGHKIRFLIITDADIVVGSIAAVWKKISKNKKTYNLLYASDLKIRPEYRSKGVVKSFLWYLFIRWPLKQDFQGWDYSYFCAMQKKNKGVDSTFKGMHLGKLAKHIGLMKIYILDPKKLINTNIKKIAYEPKNEINLSPNLSSDILWNDRKKEIVSIKDNALLKLGHLNPKLFHLNNSDKLSEAIKKVSKRKNGQLCFAIDSRNKAPIKWLGDQGIDTGTKCKIFSFPPFFNPLKSADLLTISTGEI